MSTENRIIDLVIDENVPYGVLMQFMDVDDSTNPPTETPVNLTNFTLKASIAKDLNGSAPILSFTAATVEATGGIASLTLTKANVTTLAAAASQERDTYNPRLRFAGYYDVLMTRSPSTGEPSSTRVMEGKVYISDGVTV